jgi:predicted metal-binding membrane protein
LKINIIILLISAFTWLFLFVDTGPARTIEHCAAPAAGSVTAALHTLPHRNPISSQLIGWGLMVVAMMLPKLIIPIRYIYARSFKRYRFHLSLLFILGYMATWMVAGYIMNLVISRLHLLLPGSWLPALTLGTIAIVWQFSPVKQRCLNRGHDHRTLAAFGWPASRDALQYGMVHGVWCVGSGWAIMLLPMLLPGAHNFAMIVVTFIMLSEHLEHPRAPRWRIDFRTKLLRILVAQTQIKWKQLRASN